MMRVAIQVAASAGLVVAVLWWMWRLPRKNEALLGWAPPLGLLSAWSGAASLLGSGCLWIAPDPDKWIAVLFLVLEPAAVASGVLVLWIYRGHEENEQNMQTVGLQRQQAKVGIVIGLAAVALGYFYVMTHKTPFTPVGV